MENCKCKEQVNFKVSVDYDEYKQLVRDSVLLDLVVNYLASDKYAYTSDLKRLLGIVEEKKEEEALDF